MPRRRHGEVSAVIIECTAHSLTKCCAFLCFLDLQHILVGPSMNDIESRVRAVLAEHGRLSKDAAALAPEEDLQQAGMTSHANVNVMLGLEGEFDIEFPDHMLSRAVFQSIASISAAVQQLLA